MRFSLNHSVAPLIPIPEFLAVASSVGVDAVELRDGMPPGWVFPSTSNVLTYDPQRIAQLAADSGLEILSINALQRFDQWDEDRARQAQDMITFAAQAGIPAIVLCPSVAPPGSPALPTGLPRALDALQPMLESSGIRGLVEPLGFTRSSIRTQHVVDEEFARRGRPECLGIVHDSFHHAIAQDSHYSAHTSLAHISAVPDRGLGLEELGDEHRVLVGPDDILANIDQLQRLTVDVPWSFESFATEVGESPTLVSDLRASIDYVRSGTGA